MPFIVQQTVELAIGTGLFLVYSVSGTRFSAVEVIVFLVGFEIHKLKKKPEQKLCMFFSDWSVNQRLHELRRVVPLHPDEEDEQALGSGHQQRHGR